MEDLPPFDELMAMAIHHPEQLEVLRETLSQAVIDSAQQEMKPRLRAQQSHIDRLISRGKNPHHTNVLLMRELRRQLDQLNIALTEPHRFEAQQAEIHAFPLQRGN
uniref:DUF3135 domain-containing protein n=1 Tax=Thaumasiovibrio occultus TaxID=1891184 RepID=UPI000B352ADD|nr:DUF3135 domain-containing protein [Thaumasiovibrio occultus]